MMRIQSPFSIQEDGRDFHDQRGATRRKEIDSVPPSFCSDIAPEGAVFSKYAVTFSWAVIFLVFALFWAKAAHLQMVQGKSITASAVLGSQRKQIVPAARGNIFDRIGIPLVENIPLFSLRVVPSVFFSHKEQEPAYFSALSSILDKKEEDIKQALQDMPRFFPEPLPLFEGLDFRIAVKVELEAVDIPGVSLAVESGRAYPLPLTNIGHIVGYLGKITPESLAEFSSLGYTATDWVGKSGIEAFFESILRGTPETIISEVDARGQEVHKTISSPREKGSGVYLTVDSEMQKNLEIFLSQRLAAKKLTKGAAVVLDPRNGEVLALVSLPTFDPADFETGNKERLAEILQDPDKPLFARAVAGVYPSGSVIKPVLALAALEQGIIKPNDRILSTGGLQVGQWFFPDWKQGGHGSVNLADALAWSVNTYFYTVGGGYEKQIGLGLSGIQKYFNLFGLGRKTGIELPGEAEGFYPTPSRVAQRENHWYIGDTYNLSIGQGELGVTPLQIAIMMSAFANGGTLLKPTIVSRIVDVKGQTRVIAPEVLASRLGTEANIESVRQGLRAAVERGSAQKLKGLPGGAAGKTGTAQWHKEKPPHAWFTGFYPYKNPKIAFSVLVEEGGEGSGIAAEVVKDFLDWYVSYKKQ